MVNVAPHSAEPINTSQLQVEPAVAKLVSERHPPCILAGTTQGLYVLDSEQRLELEGNPRLIYMQMYMKYERWSIVRSWYWQLPLKDLPGVKIVGSPGSSIALIFMPPMRGRSPWVTKPKKPQF